MYGRNFAERGQRGGMGFGFRGSSPPWPYVGLGRGGLPRCGYYFRSAVAPTYQPPTGARVPSKEEEISYLKDQAEAIKSQLDEIESRMRDLETKG
jgi:hypothetical protein